MHREFVVAISAFAWSWCLTTACTGEPIGAGGGEKTIVNELKALQDPTILIRRIWLDSEWNKFKDRSSDLQQTLGGVWAWRISDRQDWAVRLKAPFKMHFAGDAADDSDKGAFGDIELAAGTAFRLSDTWRAGGGLQLRMFSGTRISDNTWRLQEFGAVAWDATPWLTFSPSFEHNHSVAEQRGVAPSTIWSSKGADRGRKTGLVAGRAATIVRSGGRLRADAGSCERGIRKPARRSHKKPALSPR